MLGNRSYSRCSYLALLTDCLPLEGWASIGYSSMLFLVLSFEDLELEV